MKHGTQARQPHRRGPQRLVALHRRRRPGREQHPPLDHRERLARGDRRPAAQHVLQHRHRHLHLGADQPQARAPPGQGAAHRRHRSGSSRCARTSARRTASCPTTTSSASATRSSPSRRPSSRRSSRTRPSATGRSRSSGRCGSRASTRAAPTRPKEIKALKETAERDDDAPPVIRKIHKTGTRRRSAARPVRGDDRRQAVRRRVRARPRPARHRAGAAARGGRHRGVPRAARCCPTPPTPGTTRTSVKIGYEISFTRYFYKPQPLRTLEEIRADILALEKETEGLLGEIVGLERRHRMAHEVRARIDTKVVAHKDLEITIKSNGAEVLRLSDQQGKH